MSHCDYNLHFPDELEDHMFMVFWITSFVKCLFISFAYFSLGYQYLLLIWWELFMYIGYTFSVDYMYYVKFPLFYDLIVINKIFYFILVNCLTQILSSEVFMLVFKKSLSTPEILNIFSHNLPTGFG